MKTEKNNVYWGPINISRSAIQRCGPVTNIHPQNRIEILVIFAVDHDAMSTIQDLLLKWEDSNEV